MGTGTTIDELDRPGIKELLEEHREAKRLLAVVEDRVDAPAEHASAWAAAAASAIDELLQNLRRHFEKEEGGCLYTEVPLSAPRYAESCSRLVDEHATILEGFGRVHERLKLLAEERIGDPSSIAARTHVLVATLRRHEAEENELLTSALWEDLGSKD